MKKAVIFDLDGTLVNSIPMHFHIHQKVCRILGVTLTKDFFELKCNGRKESEFYKIILKKHLGSLKKYNEARQLSKLEHLKIHYNTLKIFSGVKYTLKKLKQAGFKIAVASSSPKKYVKLILKSNDVINYFDAFVGGDNVAHAKPSPDIFLAARKKLNIKKSECVVVEDAIAGVQAAKNAKIDCLCLLTSEKRKDIPKYAKIVEKHILLFDIISKMKTK